MSIQFSVLDRENCFKNYISKAELNYKDSITYCSQFTKEVTDEIEVLNNKKLGYEKRIECILENLPKAAKELFIKVDIKYRFNSPLAFILGKSCSMCRLEIDAITRQQIDSLLLLECCSSCGRLLIPLAAQSSS